MTRYLVRRLLLMVPTLFGVTVVSFLVMQLAPGDPLAGQGDAQGGSRETSREEYLVQKRALGLDKPILLNFNSLRNYHEAVRAAAHFLGRQVNEIVKELPGIAAADQPDTGQWKQFLTRLRIPDFETRLADPEQYEGLAQSIVDFASVWCEDAGEAALPAAIDLLRESRDEVPLRRGLIRAIGHMVGDPFIYTYSRHPSAKDTPAVTATWRLWWERNRDELQQGPAHTSSKSRKHLDQVLQELATAGSRSELMAGLERLQKSDAPFFAEKLLDDSTLAEKNVAALMLRLYVGKPLAVDASLDAGAEEVDRIAENWLVYYDVNRARYEPRLPTRLWSIVADTQYAHMAWRLVTFNFGPSALKTREPVGERIWQAFQVTAPLMLASEAVIYLVAVPLGIICAIHRGKILDRIISLLLFVLYSVPTFVAAMILLLLFCYGAYLKWFPMSGLHSDAAEELSWGPWLADYAWHAALPVLCLSLFSLAGMAMYARASMLDVISEDYVRTARAKGVSERRVIWNHALRNALIPVITLFADFLPAMLGGSVLVEVLFSIPGMGRLSWASISQKDYPTLMALVYLDAIAVLLSILLSDVLYSIVDRRITFEAPTEVE